MVPGAGGICPGIPGGAAQQAWLLEAKYINTVSHKGKWHMTGDRYLCKQPANTQPDRADKPPRPAGGFFILLGGEEEDGFRITTEKPKSKSKAAPGRLQRAAWLWYPSPAPCHATALLHFQKLPSRADAG